MTIAQGINKLTVIKKQAGLGVPASGTGGQVLRRRTSVATEARATYVNDEIAQHQQSTGVNLGTISTEWKLDGLLSPGTYSKLLGSLLRKDFSATAAITGMSITVAGSGPYTLTRAAGDFLAGGIKIGDVVRLTAGAFNAANLNKNLLVTNVTATVVTCIVVNGSTLTAEGPIASATLSVPGKKSLVPLTGHTDDLYTLEEWYADLAKSEKFTDLRMSQVQIGLPASGNATVQFDAMGIGRTLASSQVLTTPTDATTTPVLTAVRGVLFFNGAAVTNVTGAQITINGNITPEGPIVGSNVAPDMSRGRIQVTGQFTGLFDSHTIANMYHDETVTSLVLVLTADTTANADFVVFSMGRLKLTGDAPDDGEKGIVRTYPFTAELNGAGGAALANDQTIITIQDSQAA